jgi:IS30 family transposase
MSPKCDTTRRRRHPIAAAYREHGYSLRKIGAHLDRHYSTISRRLKHQEAMLQRKT